MEFFNNKENDSLKFKIVNIEGVDIDTIQPRLILITKENKNYFFIGEIQNGVCKFDIPKLESFKNGDDGKIKFEIVSEDDMYFAVWEDTFNVKTKASIKIEEMFSEITKKEEEPKKAFVKAIFEGTEKKEEKKEIKKVKEEEIVKVKEEIVKEDVLPIPSKRIDATVKHFSDFMKEK
jgi:hypothetical protein